MYIEAGSYHPKDLRVGMIESMCTMMRGEKPDSDLRTERESGSAHKSTLGVLNRASIFVNHQNLHTTHSRKVARRVI